MANVKDVQEVGDSYTVTYDDEKVATVTKKEADEDAKKNGLKQATWTTIGEVGHSRRKLVSEK